MTLRYLRPRFAYRSTRNFLQQSAGTKFFRHDARFASIDDSRKVTRSPTGSLTRYSSIVAIINQHHISSSESFVQAKRRRRRRRRRRGEGGKGPTDKDRSRVSMQMKSNCKHTRSFALVYLCAVETSCTCVLRETRGRLGERRTRAGLKPVRSLRWRTRSSRRNRGVC